MREGACYIGLFGLGLGISDEDSQSVVGIAYLNLS
jgi:hypothetical protein